MNRKSKPRYLGPYEVCRRTRNGAYIVKEIDGALLKQKIAAFRIIPYIARTDRRHLRLLADSLDDIDRPQYSSEEDMSM